MQKIQYENLIIYRAEFEYINSNMYVILDEDEAIIIDPNKNEDILELLNKNNIKKITIILTHEHPDHTSGIGWFQSKFNSKLICNEFCAEYISKKERMLPKLISFVLQEKDKKNGTNIYEKFKKNFVLKTYKADIAFKNNYKFNSKNHKFVMFNILGHSLGSCAIILDNKYVFTGDTIFKDNPVITVFKGGNKNALINQTLPFLSQRLNEDMIILPGHGESFKLGEIMRDNKIYVELR